MRVHLRCGANVCPLKQQAILSLLLSGQFEQAHLSLLHHAAQNSNFP